MFDCTSFVVHFFAKSRCNRHVERSESTNAASAEAACGLCLAREKILRFAQNDKGLGFGAQPARANDFIIAVVRLFEPCGPQPPAAEARKRAPQAAPDIPYEVTALTFAVKPLFRTLRRIHPSDCFTAPATGYRNSTTGAFGGIGSTGAIWSSSAFADGSYNVSRLFFVESLVHPLRSVYRSYGFSVRCVQASAAKPLSPPILQPAPPRHQKPAYRATGRRKTGHPRMHGRPRHAPCTKKSARRNPPREQKRKS